MSKSAAQELKARVDVVEETYEYCLAYAAKGVGVQMAASTDTPVRERLQKPRERRLPELSQCFLELVEERGGAAREHYQAFIDVLRRDADTALASVRLVLAQPGITSQMVDNLNGMIHLRALLTDVFLVDEMLRPDAEHPPHTPPGDADHLTPRPAPERLDSRGAPSLGLARATVRLAP